MTITGCGEEQVQVTDHIMTEQGMKAAKEAFYAWWMREWPNAQLYWTDKDSNWCYCVRTILDPQPYWEAWQAAIAAHCQAPAPQHLRPTAAETIGEMAAQKKRGLPQTGYGAAAPPQATLTVKEQERVFGKERDPKWWRIAEQRGACPKCLLVGTHGVGCPNAAPPQETAQQEWDAFHTATATPAKDIPGEVRSEASPADPFSKGYKHRHGEPVSDACGDGRHSECTQDLTKCHCTYRTGHTVIPMLKEEESPVLEEEKKS
jgi:hypothetical protein